MTERDIHHASRAAAPARAFAVALPSRYPGGHEQDVAQCPDRKDSRSGLRSDPRAAVTPAFFPCLFQAPLENATMDHAYTGAVRPGGLGAAAEAARRRTFAIIAHPDAGKTTPTEKLLLKGGAIQLAGQVRAKGNRRGTRSDGTKIEQDRGISVATSVGTLCIGDTLTEGEPPVVGVVDLPQPDVLASRLNVDYGIPAGFDPAPRDQLRWITSDDCEAMPRDTRTNINEPAEDHDGEIVALFASDWRRRRAEVDWPAIRFHAVREQHGLGAGAS